MNLFKSYHCKKKSIVPFSPGMFMFVNYLLVHGIPGVWMDQNQVRESGFRFEKEKHLIDPWARAVSQKRWNRKAACKPGDNSRTAMRGVVIDDSYDWER
jgi:isoamylase